jgi:hypothetical protein
MQNKPLSPRQEKSVFPKAQDTAVVGAMQGKKQTKADPQVEQAKTQLQALMKQNNIKPGDLMDLGELARKALKDQGLYPMVKQRAIQSKVAQPQEIQDGIDYRFLGSLISVGELVKQMRGSK